MNHISIMLNIHFTCYIPGESVLRLSKPTCDVPVYSSFNIRKSILNQARLNLSYGLLAFI